jgi:hypothetical protein
MPCRRRTAGSDTILDSCNTIDPSRKSPECEAGFQTGEDLKLPAFVSILPHFGSHDITAFSVGSFAEQEVLQSVEPGAWMIYVAARHQPCSLHDRGMSEPSNSDAPLKATFKVKLNGETVSIGTVGQAYRFMTNLSSVEWMEFRSLHNDAVSSLQSAAGDAPLTVEATNALRAQFVRAHLL